MGRINVTSPIFEEPLGSNNLITYTTRRKATHRFCKESVIFDLLHVKAYLLGLLAMIKCSICSYQCDN